MAVKESKAFNPQNETSLNGLYLALRYLGAARVMVVRKADRMSVMRRCGFAFSLLVYKMNAGGRYLFDIELSSKPRQRC